jgi:hypothetical protein
VKERAKSKKDPTIFIFLQRISSDLENGSLNSLKSLWSSKIQNLSNGAGILLL